MSKLPSISFRDSTGVSNGYEDEASRRRLRCRRRRCGPSLLDMAHTWRSRRSLAGRRDARWAPRPFRRIDASAGSAPSRRGFHRDGTCTRSHRRYRYTYPTATTTGRCPGGGVRPAARAALRTGGCIKGRCGTWAASTGGGSRREIGDVGGIDLERLSVGSGDAATGSDDNRHHVERRQLHRRRCRSRPRRRRPASPLDGRRQPPNATEIDGSFDITFDAVTQMGTLHRSASAQAAASDDADGDRPVHRRHRCHRELTKRVHANGQVEPRASVRSDPRRRDWEFFDTLQDWTSVYLRIHGAASRAVYGVARPFALRGEATRRVLCDSDRFPSPFFALVCASGTLRAQQLCEDDNNVRTKPRLHSSGGYPGRTCSQGARRDPARKRGPRRSRSSTRRTASAPTICPHQQQLRLHVERGRAAAPSTSRARRSIRR